MAATRRSSALSTATPSGTRPGDDLGLGPRDGLDPAEAAEVRLPDREHDGDVGRRDAREVGDVAGAVAPISSTR